MNKADKELEQLRATDPKRAAREEKARPLRARLAKKTRAQKAHPKALAPQKLKRDTAKPGTLAQGLEVLRTIAIGGVAFDVCRVTRITREAAGRGSRVSRLLEVHLCADGPVAGPIELYAIAEAAHRLAIDWERSQDKTRALGT